MIGSFADSDTERIFRGFRPREIPIQIREHGSRKLILLNAVEVLRELRTPLGNRLEKLKGDRAGLRINLQSHYDLEMQKATIGDRLDAEVKVYT